MSDSLSSATASARAFLETIDSAVGQDFYTLSSSQVDAVLAEADRVRYRQPRNANGSRARYFFERMQREARYQ